MGGHHICLPNTRIVTAVIFQVHAGEDPNTFQVTITAQFTELLYAVCLERISCDFVAGSTNRTQQSDTL